MYHYLFIHLCSIDKDYSSRIQHDRVEVGLELINKQLLSEILKPLYHGAFSKCKHNAKQVQINHVPTCDSYQVNHVTFYLFTKTPNWTDSHKTSQDAHTGNTEI